MSLARTLRALTKNKQRSVDSAVCLRTMSVTHFRNARCGPMKGDAAFKLLGGSHHQETGGESPLRSQGVVRDFALAETVIGGRRTVNVSVRYSGSAAYNRVSGDK